MAIIIMVSLYLLLSISMFSHAYENIALNKAAWQQYPYDPGNTKYNASRAVDGLKSNLHGVGGQCVLSAPGQRTATWRVDLEDIVSIRHITVYYRTDNQAWGPTNMFRGRFVGFTLYVSNTTDRADGTLCFNSTVYTTATIPAVLNVTCPFHGRYVIYHNERLPGVTYPSGYSQYTYNELCEVEVYGCPSPGFYGINCNFPCPDANCRYCHIETGVCQGCKPGYKGHQCQLKCDARKYGEGCQYDCGKCRNMAQCHHINGICLNGCEPGFKEGQCVEQNIALNKPAWQLHQYNPGDDRFNASNAVDGLKSDLSWSGGQCVISGNAQRTATWRVDLGDILSIRHITIYYRTDNAAWGSSNGYAGRFLGFSLYVSNTTDRAQGELCFHDNNYYTRATIPAVVDINCLVHGRFVIYYNERLSGVTYPSEYSPYAQNELCEVEVYGCPRPGFYGVNCSIPCPNVNCRSCHIETGACQGCKPGYKSHQCQLECDNRKYGEECLENCGNCKDLVQCHHINGTCLNGCEPGFKPGTCKDECDNRKYGQGCLENCGNCKGLLQCHHITGMCLNGCEPGFKPGTCKDECDNKKHGEGCLENCGNCKDLLQCHHINGTCLNGCEPGFKAGACKDECDNRKHGEGCLENCGNCKGQVQCHHINGTCLNGCGPGFKPGTCKDECGVGLYGDDCSKSCGQCLLSERCDNINGTCMKGCKRGFQGAFCNETCTTGTFGDDCRDLCNVTCKGCDKLTGICDSGCYPGWKGSYCGEECDKGKYGAACGLTCGYCLDDTQCHHVNGSCVGGCKEGFRGLMCKEACQDGFYGRNCPTRCSANCRVPGMCDKTSGKCEGGCQPGWRGILCDTKCDEKKYGPDCNQICGKCREGKQCHHINGSCNDGCGPGYRGDKCDTVCEFASFGESCREECSAFCLKSRDCHHVTGKCRNGCKSGWRGQDCLEVDNQVQGEETGNNLESRFYGVLGAFCVTLVVVGVLVFLLYKSSKRNQMNKAINKKYRASGSHSSRKETVSQGDDYEKINSGYQELGELSPSSPYDSIH